MSVFSEIYGDDLDREIGSTDRTQRFTTARRKRAVNQGQDEFIKRTGALVVEAEYDIADQESEFNLGAVIAADKFIRFATRQPYIKVVNGDTTTYYAGRDFPRKDIETLDREFSGWRNASAGRPQSWYLRDDGDEELLGIYPAADVKSGEVWTLVVPYVSKANTLSGDSDIPFNEKMSLEPYHQALVHYAAAQMEKLRRNYQVASAQLDAFLAYVQEYIAFNKPSDGDHVEFSHNYFSAASIRQDRDPDPLRDS